MKESYQAKPDGPSVDHSAFNELLQKHVDEDGWVDYEGFESDSETLDKYIESLETAPLDQLGRNHRLATLINAYNAFTIRLILDRLPLKIHQRYSRGRTLGRKAMEFGRRNIQLEPD